jgi:RNA polymerase sigma-70 factor (ECF subfamily)
MTATRAAVAMQLEEPPARAESPPAVDPDQDVRDLIAARAHERALRLLMQRHGAAVYRFCREALRDPALADDVHQQVFIEAFRDFDGYGGRSTLRTWLFAIARHRCLDAAKGRTRWTSRFKNDAGDELSDPRPDAGARIDDARLQGALAACLDELGEHVRTAVLLRYQQGFSFEDMSSVCREKAGTLQARVARALPVLRACIQRRTGGEL